MDHNRAVDRQLYGEPHRIPSSDDDYVDMDNTPLLATHTGSDDNNNNALRPQRAATRPVALADLAQPADDNNTEDHFAAELPTLTPAEQAIREIKDRANNSIWYAAYQPHLLLAVLTLLLTTCLYYCAPGYIPNYDVGENFIPETNELRGGVTWLNTLTFTVCFWFMFVYSALLVAYNALIAWKYPLFSRRYYKSDVVIINGTAVTDDEGNNRKRVQQKQFLEAHQLPLLPPIVATHYTRMSLLAYLGTIAHTVIFTVATILNIALYRGHAAMIFTQRFVSKGEPFPDDLVELREQFVNTQHGLAYGVVIIQVAVLVALGMLAKRAYYRDRLLKPERYTFLSNVLELFRNRNGGVAGQ